MVGAIRRGAAVPRRRTAVLRVAVPATAPINERRPAFVFGTSPFTNVPKHIVNAPLVRKLSSDFVSTNSAVIVVPSRFVKRNPVSGTARTGATSIFPLFFCRQSKTPTDWRYVKRIKFLNKRIAFIPRNSFNREVRSIEPESSPSRRSKTLRRYLLSVESRRYHVPLRPKDYPS